MIKFYVDRINSGKMELDQVPAKWREAVAEELKK